jgi:hypothetical protein
MMIKPPRWEKTTIIRTLVSVSAITLLVLKLVFPSLPIDVVAVALFAIALLPWLGEVLKSIKVGSVEIELRQYRSDAAKAVEDFRAYAQQQAEGAWWKSAAAELWEGAFDPKEPYAALADALFQVHYWLRKFLRRGQGVSRDDTGTPEEALEALWSLPEGQRELRDQDGYLYLKNGLTLLRRGLRLHGMTSDAVNPALIYARNMLSYLDYLPHMS